MRTYTKTGAPGGGTDERREEELEALLALYGESVLEADRAAGVVRLSLWTTEKVPREFEVELEVPGGYPEEPPFFRAVAPWLPPQSPPAVEGTLFDSVEQLRSLVSAYGEAVPAEAPQAAPGAAPAAAPAFVGASWEALVASLGVRHGEVIVDRKSAFQAHVAPARCMGDVRSVRDALLLNPKIARAAHNILAYRFRPALGRKLAGSDACPSPATDRRGKRSAAGKCPEPQASDSASLLKGHDSDGEHAAGGRVQHLLDIMDAQNVVVVVTRWFGGILLGPDRFKHINNAARQALETFGFSPSRAKG